jgi:ABC-type multidrug transport system fused ATPase/permease subunit
MLGHKDKRVQLTKDIIDGIKSIKYFSWEKIFEKKIMGFRKKEYRLLAFARGMDGILGCFWNSINIILLYFFLTGYVNKGRDIHDSNIFVVIALFNMLTMPIGIIPWSINQFLKCRISFKRINKYLQFPDIESINQIQEIDEYTHKTS